MAAMPPPPVPRRHPSRPQLRADSAASVASAASVSSSASASSLSASPSLGAGAPPSRPTSAIYLGPSPASDAGSAVSAKRPLGIAIGNVGLGSPKLDFKDWAKAGRADELERPAKSPARSLIDDVSGLPSPPSTDVSKAPDAAPASAPAPASAAASPNPVSSESTPTMPAEATPVSRRRPTLSPVRVPYDDRLAPRASPSQSSGSSDLAGIGATATSRRLSTDLTRIMSGSPVGSPLSAAGSRHARASQPASPERRASPTKRASPDKLRQRRSPSSAHSSPRKRGVVPDELPERKKSGGDELDDKIKAAEEKIAKYNTQGSRRWDTRGTPSRAHGHDMPSDVERSGGSGGSGKRKPLPDSFRNGALYTPSPKASLASDPPLSAHSVRSQRFDTFESPSRSRYSSLRQQREPDMAPSPSTRSVRRIDGLERSATSGPVELASPMRPGFDPVSGLPSEFRDESDLSRQSSRLRRARPESVLGTPGEQRRYRQSDPPLEHDFAGLRIGLAPSDSISAVGARDGKRDPLEVLRRLEEQRSQHNRRWEHERSESVLGTARPSSRLERTPQHARPTTSMSSMRELYAAAPRTAPHDSFSRRAQYDGAVLDSPSLGRSSRMSVLAGEPRHVRSNTSLGRHSAGSVHEPAQLPAPTTEHGRILVDALRAIQARLPDADLSRALQATAATADHASGAVRAAGGIAADLAVGLELDDAAALREQATRLTMALRDAGRAADQNVRELTQALLALGRHLVAVGPAPNGHAGHVVHARQASHAQAPSLGGSFRTPRRSDGSIDNGPRNGPPPHQPSDFGPRWSLDAGSPMRERPATSMGGIYSPGARHGSQFGSISSLAREPAGYGHAYSHAGHGVERASTVSHGSASSRAARHYELPLHTIQASPTRPSAAAHSPARFSPAPGTAPDTAAPADRADRRTSRVSGASDPPRPPRAPERSLRHKASAASNHTVRASAPPAHAHAHSHSHSHSATSATSSASPVSSTFLPQRQARTTTAVSQVFGEAQVSPAAGGAGRFDDGEYDDDAPDAGARRDWADRGDRYGSPRPREHERDARDGRDVRDGRDGRGERGERGEREWRDSPRRPRSDVNGGGGEAAEGLSRRLSVTDRFRQHLRTQRESSV